MTAILAVLYVPETKVAEAERIGAEYLQSIGRPVAPIWSKHTAVVIDGIRHQCIGQWATELIANDLVRLCYRLTGCGTVGISVSASLQIMRAELVAEHST